MSVGVRRIGEQYYLEEYRSFNKIINVTVAGQRIETGLKLPGAAPFILKFLTRAAVDAAGSLVERRFLFRFGNSAGDKWYSEAGIDGTTELTLDTLIFGSGSFPYPIFPHIIYDYSSTITQEFLDISGTVPYDIYLSFIGAYLLPIASEEVINRQLTRGTPAELTARPAGETVGAMQAQPAALAGHGRQVGGGWRGGR